MKSQYSSLSYLLNLAKYLSLLSMLSLMSGFHSVWFPYCIVGSDLLIFCWRFLHVYLSRINSVQSLSRIRFFATPWTAARQTSLSITNSWSLLKLISSESVMPSSHLILCRPLLLLPSIFPSIRVFSDEPVLCIRWPKYWSFSFSISPSTKYSELIAFEMDSLDLHAVQGISKVFFNTTVQKHQSPVLIFLNSPTLTSIYDYWKNHSFY